MTPALSLTAIALLFAAATIGNFWPTFGPTVEKNQRLNRFKISGGAAVYKPNRIEQRLRDIFTINQRVIIRCNRNPLEEGLLLGLPPEQILL